MEEKKTPICYKPGTEVPESGIYVNPTTGERTTCVSGEPFPPTSREDQCWQPEIPTDPKDR